MFRAKSGPKSVETRVYLEEMVGKVQAAGITLAKGRRIPRMAIARFVTPLALVGKRSFEPAHSIRVNTDANPSTFDGYN
ncbi:hypothetical protein [Caballeronia sp. RCC_10]|uniref:hypothetical protein n=1 Tax=Caballeronia sp. RCC_10 TaxID=3239227 RepID=UPI00352671EB